MQKRRGSTPRPRILQPAADGCAATDAQELSSQVPAYCLERWTLQQEVLQVFCCPSVAEWAPRCTHILDAADGRELRDQGASGGTLGPTAAPQSLHLMLPLIHPESALPFSYFVWHVVRVERRGALCCLRAAKARPAPPHNGAETVLAASCHACIVPGSKNQLQRRGIGVGGNDR